MRIHPDVKQYIRRYMGLSVSDNQEPLFEGPCNGCFRKLA